MAEDFENLIRVHLGRIRRIASRYADGGSAPDLAQEILIRRWQSTIYRSCSIFVRCRCAKLEAVEEMAEVVRLLERMRAAEKAKTGGAPGRSLDRI